MRVLLQALLLLTLAPKAFAKAPGKLITVVTADWAATTGELRRWERDGKTWRAVGDAVPVVVGKSGLKWPADKREGDGASPAGRFALGDVTGYDRAPPDGIKLRYLHATQDLRCVDDPTHRSYNRLFRYSFHEKDPLVDDAPWEAMRRTDELYRLTIFVRHNPTNTPGMGSCIFLHAWSGPQSSTVGCTAMAFDHVRELVVWSDPSTELVQLPRDEYDKRQREWGLPQRK